MFPTSYGGEYNFINKRSSISPVSFQGWLSRPRHKERVTAAVLIVLFLFQATRLEKNKNFKQ